MSISRDGDKSQIGKLYMQCLLDYYGIGKK